MIVGPLVFALWILRGSQPRGSGGSKHLKHHQLPLAPILSLKLENFNSWLETTVYQRDLSSPSSGIQRSMKSIVVNPEKLRKRWKDRSNEMPTKTEKDMNMQTSCKGESFLLNSILLYPTLTGKNDMIPV